MDRRDFIEKSAVAAGGVLLAATGAEALANNKNGKTMKVLMINGSPHQKGNTAIALDEIAKQLKINGFDDDVCNRISEKFAEADALIVGSPVYYGQPNGAVLSVIQRAFYSNGASISGKPAAAVAVCRRGGATASFETLNMPFQMMNMPVVASQYWNIVYGAAQGQASLDTEGLQTMRTLANNMAWLLKATGGEPAPGRADEPWKGMNFIR